MSGPLGLDPLRSLPRHAWVLYLARGTRLTGLALCLPRSACNLLSTCLVARPHPALFLGGHNWDFAVAGWPCLYSESSAYITVLRRMVSALPGLLITSADWKSAVGTPRSMGSLLLGGCHGSSDGRRGGGLQCHLFPQIGNGGKCTIALELCRTVPLCGFFCSLRKRSRRGAPCGTARARWCTFYRCRSARKTSSAYHFHDDRHQHLGSRSVRGCPLHLVGERSRSGASCGRARTRSCSYCHFRSARTRSADHLHDDRHYRHGNRSGTGCPRHRVGERSRSGVSCGRK